MSIATKIGRSTLLAVALVGVSSAVEPAESAAEPKVNAAPAVTNPRGEPLLYENNATDVRFETDFRSVYARVIDQWLGANSVSILGGNFSNPMLTFV